MWATRPLLLAMTSAYRNKRHDYMINTRHILSFFVVANLHVHQAPPPTQSVPLDLYIQRSTMFFISEGGLHTIHFPTKLFSGFISLSGIIDKLLCLLVLILNLRYICWDSPAMAHITGFSTNCFFLQCASQLLSLVLWNMNPLIEHEMVEKRKTFGRDPKRSTKINEPTGQQKEKPGASTSHRTYSLIGIFHY